jgi:hypothetical protein
MFTTATSSTTQPHELALSNLSSHIQNNFYTCHLADAHENENQSVSDCISEYCHYNPLEAGKILNKNINKFWNTFVTECLIDSGADVNQIYSEKYFPTLLQAIKSNSKKSTIHKLIQHGANYDAYQENHEGITYTIMLITALENNREALEILIEQFPHEVEKTNQSIKKMLEKNINFPCALRDTTYNITVNGIKKIYYGQKDIATAKILMEAISSNKSIDKIDSNALSRFGLWPASQRIAANHTTIQHIKNHLKK